MNPKQNQSQINQPKHKNLKKKWMKDFKSIPESPDGETTINKWSKDQSFMNPWIQWNNKEVYGDQKKREIEREKERKKERARNPWFPIGGVTRIAQKNNSGTSRFSSPFPCA